MIIHVLEEKLENYMAILRFVCVLISYISEGAVFG
jgi:hypothetical protein